MDDTPLLRRQLGLVNAGPRYRHHRLGIANLARAAVPGRDRVFLLERFLRSSIQSADCVNTGGRILSNGIPNMNTSADHEAPSTYTNMESTASGITSIRFIQQNPVLPTFWSSQPPESMHLDTGFPPIPVWAAGPSHENGEWNNTLVAQELPIPTAAGNVIPRSHVFPSQESLLVKLPPSVLASICDWLSWGDKELLSRTCTLFRQQLHPSCKESVLCMPLERHIQHQNEIARGLPMHAVCADCGRLHRIILGDVPAVCCRSTGLLCPSKLKHRQRVPDLACGYQLEHHHVHLALKLRRLRLFETYADALLQPFFAVSRNDETLTAMQVFIRPIITLQEPEPSFLVFRGMEFREMGCEESMPLGADTIQSLIVCPHASLSECEPEEIRCQIFYDAIEDARLGLVTRHDFSCRRCPTDVRIDTQPGRLRVCVWQDFGTESVSPLDAAWTVHVGGPTNSEFAGPTIPHSRGSVRVRYELARQQQTETKTVSVCSNHGNSLNKWALRELAELNIYNRLQGYLETEESLDEMVN